MSVTKRCQNLAGAILHFIFDPISVISDPENYENYTHEEENSNFRRRHLRFWF
jgi:hypothetical protein